MYAAHFAVGMAIKVAEPRAPLGTLLVLAFLPDLFWLAFSVTGIEIVARGQWFDGWSHSIASIVLQGALVAFLWSRQGLAVSAAVACAVLSHLFLDLPMHPAPLEWYPHATTGVGDFLHGWARSPALFGKTNGWWTEAAIVFCGLSIYWVGSRRAGIEKATAGAAAILVASLHAVFG
ncbi:MAG TPA: hypothetical protein VF033_08630 [Steroidobacteraceae bacterium]|jgi:hypothetical protein